MKKVRVYEYAKEIGKQSKDIIKVLRESEIEVSNHMSMLTEEGLAKLDSIFKAKKEELINSSLQLLKHLQKKQFQKTLS